MSASDEAYKEWHERDHNVDCQPQEMGDLDIRRAWCAGWDKALEEVETIAELYHNPVAQAIINEIQRLQQKKP